MKRLYCLLITAILLSITSPLVKAAADISVDFFYDKLEPYGDWMEIADYGYCWHPRDVGPDWRPYNDGRWVYTDAGWTWDSEDPYGWAVYHYGRWTQVEGIGWVWVPGGEWGPAWVSWRSSPTYVGWAPLPPEAQFTRSSGFHSRVDAEYDIGPDFYSFVQVRDFGAPRLRGVIIQPQRNVTIIENTRNITRITYVNNVVYNEGPRYEVISREITQPIPRLKLERREHVDPRTVGPDQLRARVEGNSFQVTAFPVDTKTKAAPKKVSARVEKAKVDHGWKNAGPPAEVQKLRTKIKNEPALAAAEETGKPPTSTGQAPSASPSPGSELRPSKPGQAETHANRPAAGTTTQPSPSAQPSPTAAAITTPPAPSSGVTERTERPTPPAGAPSPIPAKGPQKPKPTHGGKHAPTATPATSTAPSTTEAAPTPAETHKKGKKPSSEPGAPAATPGAATQKPSPAEGEKPPHHQPATAEQTPRQSGHHGEEANNPKQQPTSNQTRPPTGMSERPPKAAPPSAETQKPSGKDKGKPKDKKEPKEGAKPEDT